MPPTKIQLNNGVISTENISQMTIYRSTLIRESILNIVGLQLAVHALLSGLAPRGFCCFSSYAPNKGEFNGLQV